jgi:uncharacterized peroxidase-related enzyme
MQFRPETSAPLNMLVEVLLRSDEGITRGERELIAAYVSSLNECQYCSKSHGAYAARQLDGGHAVVDAVRADLATAPVSDKMRALLRIAAKVQESGQCVTEDDVAAARAEGATDVELHDTVLIAAAFCMYNRYVDGLATWAPDDEESYERRADMIVEHGYMALNASLHPPQPD